ncbi:MAG: hypothetical protein WB780_04385 [Candidatus Acidiferrales bacterium]
MARPNGIATNHSYHNPSRLLIPVQRFQARKFPSDEGFLCNVAAFQPT